MKVTWNSDSYAQFLQPTFDIKPDLKLRYSTISRRLNKACAQPYSAKMARIRLRALSCPPAFITFISCSRSKNEPATATDSIAQATAHSFTVNMHISKMCIAYWQSSLTTHISMRKIQKLWPISLHTPLHFKRSLIRDNHANKTSEFKFPTLNDSIPIKYGIIVQTGYFMVNHTKTYA